MINEQVKESFKLKHLIYNLYLALSFEDHLRHLF